MSWVLKIQLAFSLVTCELFVHQTVRARERPVVATKQGDLAGVSIISEGRRVNKYLGVPFAEAPVGNLRFKKPIPVKPWTGVRDSSKHALPCMQLPLQIDEKIFLDYGNNSEDCLYLNVWQPASAVACEKNDSQSACGLRPIVVYIYGGGFLTGDASFFVFRGERFAALTDLIYITFNYRLGILGFFKTDLPEFSGNAGMFDQIEALKWIKQNAKAFGGDSDQITVWGQSAGAISISYHMLSPLSEGLFKRAFLQSGVTATGVPLQRLNNQGAAHRVLGVFDCYNATVPWKNQAEESVKCLQKVDPNVLLKRSFKELPITTISFLPTFGDEFLPNNPITEGLRIRTGQEFLVSTTPDEGSLFVVAILLRNPHLRILVSDDFRSPVRILMRLLLDVPSAKTNAIVDAYLKGMASGHVNETEWKMNIAKLFGDSLFECAADSFGAIAAKQGHPVYRFLFDHKPSFSIWDNWFGVTHGDDIIFSLGTTPDLKSGFEMYGALPEDANIVLKEPEDEEKEFSWDLVRVIGSFAKYG
ncbi:unnamed protein product [Ixodes hexagonus]